MGNNQGKTVEPIKAANPPATTVPQAQQQPGAGGVQPAANTQQQAPAKQNVNNSQTNPPVSNNSQSNPQLQQSLAKPPLPGNNTLRSVQEEGEEDMDGEITLPAGANTFIGNTVKPGQQSLQQPLPSQSIDPNNKGLAPAQQQPPMLQSDQGAVVNRFKDSIDANLPQKNFPNKQPTALNQSINPPPSQVQVQSVLDSYQQQMKEFKSTVNDIDNNLNSQRMPSVQEEGEEEGYSTMGPGDRITTFRTEMMSKDMNSVHRPSVQVSQAPYGQQQITPQVSHTSNNIHASLLNPVSNNQSKPMNSMPQVIDPYSQPSQLNQSINHQEMFQSQKAYGEGNQMTGYSPYQSTFPDFRQDTRPTFNVDFRQDTKPIHQSVNGMGVTYNQQQNYQQVQQQQQSAYNPQQTMQSMQPISNNQNQNFRQDTKFSSMGRPGDISQFNDPSYQKGFTNPQLSQHQDPSIHQQTQYSQSQPNQSIRGQPQPSQQSRKDVPFQYDYPEYQAPEVDMSKLPAPRDSLLTGDQKSMLKLGSYDNMMQKKLEQPSNHKSNVIGGGAHHNQDEDELGLSGYYNFDRHAGPQLNKEAPQVSAARAKQIAQQQKDESQYQSPTPQKQQQQQQQLKQEDPEEDLNRSTQQNLRSTAHSQHTGGNANLTLDEVQYQKELFVEQEERERLNPSNMLVRVLFIHAFNSQVDEEQAAHEEATTERRLYSFFIGKNAKVQDVKQNRIKKEFGFDIDQVKLYFRYKELNNQQMLMDIEHFDLEEDILTCITINAPKVFIPAILRDPLEDIKIADVRLLNSRDRADAHGKGDASMNFELESFDVDQDKLPWPVYRDWTAEAAYLSQIIVRDKQAVLSDEQQFLMQQGITSWLHQSAELAELTEAEAAFKKLSEDFRKASLYAVHLVVKKNPTPLNLFNLYGDEGDKFVVGGIIVRRAKDWTVCGQPFTEAAKLHTTAIGNNQDTGGSNLVEISGKVASLDVRNLAVMRNRLPRLVVPLASLVDYYGLKFECQSLAPISINSLVYGSDTNGLTFVNKDAHAEAMAHQMAALLNLKPHYLEEQATLKLKISYLPYTVQLHRNKDLQGDTNLYLVNPMRLFPQDESLRQPQSSNPNATQQPVPIQEIMSKQLRPEITASNNKGEPDPDCQYFTWKRPTKCDECGEWINDYEYYFYEKKSVDKTQRVLVQYYCCAACFMERLPTENFKYPVNKIVKRELQAKDRLQFYQNMKTGHRFMTMQFSRCPLNPDAYFHISNGKDKADKISEQEEILRAAQKLKDEVLRKLLEDFNNVEEDPMNGEQLALCLHKRGINVRMLGRICTSADLNHIREICVIEVIARSAKLLIKDGLTFLADDEEAGFQTDNIRKCVLHYLLEIFNVADSSGSQTTTSSQNIWDFITEHARKKFQVTVEKDTLSKVNMSGLLVSIAQKINLRLRRSVRDIDFYSVDARTGERNFLTIEDIESITPIVKDYTDEHIVVGAKEDVFPASLNTVLESARMKDKQGKRTQWYHRGSEEREEATELFRLAASICEQIYGSQSLKYARLLKEFAEQLESRHQEKGRPENSRWNKSFAIPEDDYSSEARFFYNTALENLKTIKADFSIEGAEINLGLARLVKPRGAQFAHYREQDTSVYDTFSHLMQAVEIYETVLGFDHPETADAYTKMALAYQEQGNSPAASPWIRRAFCVFYKGFGPHDPITQGAYESLKAIETNVDSRLDQVPFEELPHVIFEIEKQNKLMADQQQQIAMLNQGAAAMRMIQR